MGLSNILGSNEAYPMQSNKLSATSALFEKEKKKIPKFSKNVPPPICASRSSSVHRDLLV
jgi:hypothetical protein